MKTRSEKRPRQVVSEEVQRSLLELIQRKFYDGFPVQFAKDTYHLQRWVIYWPAREWFDLKGLSVPNHRYLEIVTKVLLDAASFQKVKAKYPPAFLKAVIQSHFEHHGDEYYREAKSARSLADHALATIGKITPAGHDDVVTRFVAADRLLAASKRTVRRTIVERSKTPVKEQLNLF